MRPFTHHRPGHHSPTDRVMFVHLIVNRAWSEWVSPRHGPATLVWNVSEQSTIRSLMKLLCFMDYSMPRSDHAGKELSAPLLRQTRAWWELGLVSASQHAPSHLRDILPLMCINNACNNELSLHLSFILHLSLTKRSQREREKKKRERR